MSKQSALSLSRLESEIMNAVWNADPEPASVRDVLDEINSHRKKKLAYNTVQTVMTILKEKKAIRQVDGSGRAHYFRPCYSRENASRHIWSDLAKRLFSGSVKPMIHQMIDDPSLSPEDLSQLRSWVDEKLRDQPPGKNQATEPQ